MEKSLLKLKCRNCDDIIVVTGDNQLVACKCGNCTLGLKNSRVHISSKNGYGDYLLYNGDEEYIFISKKELEEY